jgi:hypothetical protein
MVALERTKPARVLTGSRHRHLDPCVRFAASVTRSPRNTRFRLVASLCRAGLATRRGAQRASEFRYPLISLPLPRLRLAQHNFSDPLFAGHLGSPYTGQGAGDPLHSSSTASQTPVPGGNRYAADPKKYTDNPK